MRAIAPGLDDTVRNRRHNCRQLASPASLKWEKRMPHCVNSGCKQQIPETHVETACPQCGTETFVALVRAFGQSGVSQEKLASLLNVPDDVLKHQFTDPHVSVRIMAYHGKDRKVRYAHVTPLLGYVERYRGAFGLPDPSPPSPPSGVPYGFPDF
jgi:predicted RNA-binding Zn-ribbon protein involved in translation (DUF1610 family)